MVPAVVIYQSLKSQDVVNQFNMAKKPKKPKKSAARKSTKKPVADKATAKMAAPAFKLHVMKD